MSPSPNTILFLVNPFAGKGKAMLIAKKTIDIIRQNGYETELFEGKNKEDFLENFSKQRN